MSMTKAGGCPLGSLWTDKNVSSQDGAPLTRNREGYAMVTLLWYQATLVWARFATNLIKNISVEQGLPTLFFSFQLPEYMVSKTFCPR